MNYKKSDTKDRNETYLAYVKVHPMSLNKRDTEDAVTKGVVVYPFLF